MRPQAGTDFWFRHCPKGSSYRKIQIEQLVGCRFPFVVKYCSIFEQMVNAQSSGLALPLHLKLVFIQSLIRTICFQLPFQPCAKNKRWQTDADRGEDQNLLNSAWKPP